MTTLPRRGGELGREIRAAYAFVERNANLIKRYWAWELVWLAYSIVSALAVTLIGRASSEITGAQMTVEQVNTFILFLMVGTLVWHYLSMVFDMVSEAIQWERWEGTIEYTFMAPISRLTHLLGQAAFAREGPANDQYHQDAGAAGQRRVLPGQRVAGLDAAIRPAVAGGLHARRDARGAARRRVDPARCRQQLAGIAAAIHCAAADHRFGQYSNRLVC